VSAARAREGGCASAARAGNGAASTSREQRRPRAGCLRTPGVAPPSLLLRAPTRSRTTCTVVGTSARGSSCTSRAARPSGHAMSSRVPASRAAAIASWLDVYCAGRWLSEQQRLLQPSPGSKASRPAFRARQRAAIQCTRDPQRTHTSVKPRHVLSACCVPCACPRRARRHHDWCWPRAAAHSRRVCRLASSEMLTPSSSARSHSSSEHSMLEDMTRSSSMRTPPSKVQKRPSSYVVRPSKKSRRTAPKRQRRTKVAGGSAPMGLSALQ